MANEATVTQLVVLRRAVLFPVSYESKTCDQGLEARVLAERLHLGEPETARENPARVMQASAGLRNSGVGRSNVSGRATLHDEPTG